MSKYKSEWKQGEVNEAFWNEVLVGRTIVELKHKEGKLVSFKLDNGEEVFIVANENSIPTLAIED